MKHLILVEASKSPAALIETTSPVRTLLPSFPRTRESSAFRARTLEVAGFPPSRE
ncbi:hypothetical protein [Lysobacter gummosus]|uniref:hypothetical protein n=1 Tax=Lysobacter gummosus TaxID=262324 RepID=UPI003644184A